MFLHRKPTGTLVAIAIAAMIVNGLAVSPSACPFCNPVAQTFTEQMAASDIVVIAELSALPSDTKSADEKPDSEKTDAELARGDSSTSEFTIVEVIKGKASVKKGMTFRTVFFGKAKSGDKFLIMGVDPPDIFWTTPLSVKEEVIAYLKDLRKLPEDGPKRIAFFHDYMENENEVIARDTYEEFARAPYEDVIALKPQMDRKQLIEWVKSPEIPASRKRLYYTMLGICGQAEDAGFLEEMMQSDDRLVKASLDAMIACYINLKKSEALDLVDKLFLADAKADYSDTYSSISAIRFHGMETDVVSRERILQSLRLMLDRPKHADLVIPDLARWEDWSMMDRLVKLFKDSTKQTSWLRVPVLNYLRACPLPEAAKHLKELGELDPNAMKRAQTFFPLLDALDDLDEDEESDAEESNESEEADDEATEKETDKEKEPVTDSKTNTSATESANLANDSGIRLPGVENVSESNIAQVSQNISPATLVAQTGATESDLEDCVVPLDDSANMEKESEAKNQNRKETIAEPDSENSNERTTTLRPVIDPDESDFVVAQQADKTSSGAPVVAEIPLFHSVLIGVVPLAAGFALFCFLWLVMSGRIDRIGF